MKKMMMISLTAAAMCAGMFAQSADRITVHFSTPVEISGTTVSGGDCDIEVVRSSTDPLVLVFRPESGSPFSTVANRLTAPEVEDAMTDHHARVVLTRHENEYRLDRILLPDGSGYRILTAQE
jgi:hypothetical protein